MTKGWYCLQHLSVSLLQSLKRTFNVSGFCWHLYIDQRPQLRILSPRVL